MTQFIQVLVQTYYRNQTHAICINVEDTVVDLKKKIAEKEKGLYWDKQSDQRYVRLMMANTELNDNDIIGQVCLEQDITLKLLPRIKGFAEEKKEIVRAKLKTKYR